MRHIALIMMIATLFSGPAYAVSLKQQAVVQNDVITLGDLFNGLDHDAERVLGAAPRPGEDMVLTARTLLRVALAMDLSWRPSSSYDQLVVRRAATVIDEDHIKEAIRTALLGEGVDGLYDLTFMSGDPQIILPPDMPPNVDVSKVKHDPETGWFEISLAAPSKADPEVEAHFTGKIERLSTIPVLRDTARAGMVIGERDIQMITVPSRSLNHDVILRAEDLKGLTPRRMLVAGKPIKEQDVEFPRIVERGENVTMIYKSGPLQLTASGKALQFGAKGDIVRVVNNQSSLAVDAMVTGEREVTVQSF